MLCGFSKRMHACMHSFHLLYTKKNEQYSETRTRGDIMKQYKKLLGFVAVRDERNWECVPKIPASRFSHYLIPTANQQEFSTEYAQPQQDSFFSFFFLFRFLLFWHMT